MTLIEIMVATGILSIILGGVYETMISSSRTWRTTVRNSTLERRAHRAMSAIAEELVDAGFQTVTVSNGLNNWSPEVVFQKNLGWNGTSLDWSNPVRVSFEQDPNDAADGIDNDGDGFVDEGVLMLTRDFGLPQAVSTPLATNVAGFAAGETEDGTDENGNGLADEKGFTAQVVGNALVLRLTLLARDADGFVTEETVESTAKFRN